MTTTTTTATATAAAAYATAKTAAAVGAWSHALATAEFHAEDAFCRARAVEKLALLAALDAACKEFARDPSTGADTIINLTNKYLEC